MTLSVFVLMQISVAFAKPTPIAFEMASMFTVDRDQIVELGKTTVIHVIGHGELTGDIVGPFTFSDTITEYHDNTGAARYITYNQLIEITTASGTLVLQANLKAMADTSVFEQTGTWKVVYGTGLMAAVNGGGTYYPWFTFEGTIR